MNFAPAAGPDSSGGCLAEAIRQRKQALGCLWLSLVLSVALLISNFGDHSTPWLDLQPMIKNYQQMLSEGKQLLQVNQLDLKQVKAALEALKKPAGVSKP